MQTACSTSLVAVHLACQSLLNHECDLALAGGVSISLPQTAGYLYEEGDIASPDGRCRAFDASAMGCIKGNGSALVVLRRLEDALRDGDDIRAVIKATAVNNDGSDKIGFTAPSVSGQSSVIAEALAAADIEPSSIGYVEAHGTGTPLGDPIEVAALRAAFGSVGIGRCALGSIKTNLGHLDAAAGVVGLIKAALALQHREIPPSLHFERANPKLELERSPFYVNAALRAWPEGTIPRRAGVSSFGIGGTNAHAILEEAPTHSARPSATSNAEASELLLLSAGSEPALLAASEALASRLESGGASLADVAWTLAVGRKRLSYRRAVVARDVKDAIGLLRKPPAREETQRDERRGTEVAFLFPGQGAQRAGMARELYAGEPRFHASIDRSAAILDPLLGLDWRAILLDPSADPARLTQTALAQPSLFAIEHAMAELWMSWGVEPAVMAGHSIGEYVAACLAGVMSFEDALALVAERGRLMGSCAPGAMLATTLQEDELRARLARHPRLDLAAINAPGSTVASGPTEAIAALETELSAEGIATRRLETSHAFHSAMMDPILDAFEARVRAVALRAGSRPFYSNLTGALIRAEEATDPRYWREHLRHSVRFGENLARLAADPALVLLEVGPGSVLSSLARRVAPALTVASSLPRPGEDEAESMRVALGKLWIAGVDLEWSAILGAGRRVPLPTYPFERDRYWIDDTSPQPAPTGGSALEGKNPDLAQWFYLPSWRRTFLRGAAPTAEPSWLLFDDGSELARDLAAFARARGARVTTLLAHEGPLARSGDEARLDPRDPAAMTALLRELRAEGVFPERVVHLWCRRAEAIDAALAAREPSLELGFFALLHWLQAAGLDAPDAEVHLVAVVEQLHDVVGDEAVDAERAALAGICRVAPLEYPWLRARLLDLDAAPHAEAGLVVAELDAADREPLVAWRGGHRWVPAYEPVELPAREESERDGIAQAAPAHTGSLRPDGVFVLTGGPGLLELAIARRLLDRGARAIAFLGASEEELVALRGAGVPILALPADAERLADLPPLLEQVRQRFGAIDAIFHTAGEIGGGLIQLKERAQVEHVIEPRVGGADELLLSMREEERLVLFSSAISATGVFGQVDYCAASAIADALAESGDERVTTIGWGMAHWDRWQSASGPSGEALLAELKRVQAAIGITIEEGVEALFRALDLGARRIFITTQDLRELAAQASAASAGDVLGAMGGGAARAGSASGLETETEARVAELWIELLGTSAVGRTDNFFDLGGNSLVAIQLASRLRKMFEIEITIAELFTADDLAGLAAAVDRAVDDRLANEEVVRLLDEIEALSELEVRAEFERDAGGGA